MASSNLRAALRLCACKCPRSSSCTATAPLKRTSQARALTVAVARRSNQSTHFPWYLLTVPLPLFFLSEKLRKPVECSPTFNGVPVAATFLIHQATPKLDAKFPGLEISPIFDINQPQDYKYEEESTFLSIMPSYALVEVPMYEKLSSLEEAKLGVSGLKKNPVGKAVLKGSCSLGCAKVTLVEIKLLKLNGDLVWEWKKKGN
ncbi:hypothetical protein HDU85_003739 [Gaertneriomyces sp. JEL0708]|nr:hypothetical protein HDU85_003739 [Gaertneriomyces sp. JEL0708]